MAISILKCYGKYSNVMLPASVLVKTAIARELILTKCDVNENVKISDLEKLEKIVKKVIQQFCE